MNAPGKRRLKRRVSLANDWRQNALRAAEETGAGLLARLRARPDELEALRRKRAPALTAPEFLRSAALLTEIYQESLTLVFRLLFLRLAESRHLLPSRTKEHDGTGCLASLRARALLIMRAHETMPAELGPAAPTPDDSLLWPHLQALFRRVADVRGAESTIARGWLFDPAQHELLERYPPAAPCLARAIELLTRAAPEQDESDRSAGAGQRDARRLGRVYEAALELTPRLAEETGDFFLARERRASRRKRSGSYYTPERVARYLVEKALGPLVRGEQREGKPEKVPLSAAEILRLRVLDPAMGCGFFLLTAGDYLARAYADALVREGQRDGATASHVSLSAGRRKVAEHCLYGVDVDPVAVELAKLSLQLFVMAREQPLARLHEHLKCGDTLAGMQTVSVPRAAAKSNGLEASKSKRSQLRAADKQRREDSLAAAPFAWRAEFPEVFDNKPAGRLAAAGFDAVVGNPPYLSFSGRQKAKGYALPAQGELAQGARGWRSSHGLFMAGAVRLLKPDGLAAMIVPDQVGHLHGYGATRAAVLESAKLIEVCYWGEDVFAGASTPALTFVAQRAEGTCARMFSAAARLVRRDGSIASFCPRGADEWYVSPQQRIYEAARAAHPPLTSYCDAGAHTGNVAAKLILRAPAEGATPVLAGRQIRAFRCDPPAAWLNVNYRAQPGEYFHLAAPEVYAATDILIRQTADRPIAARHTYRCPFRNSVLALRAPEGYSVEYLLGLLNSNVVGWLYRAATVEAGQRAFPQVKLRALRHLPLPDPRQPERQALVARIEEIARRLEASQPETHEFAREMAQLDELVTELYGLAKLNLA